MPFGPSSSQTTTYINVFFPTYQLPSFRYFIIAKENRLMQESLGKSIKDKEHNLQSLESLRQSDVSLGSHHSYLSGSVVGGVLLGADINCCEQSKVMIMSHQGRRID